jgi:hypothetical protein
MNPHHYAIKNAYVKYNDASTGMNIEPVNLTHEGSGDFTLDLFTLQTIQKPMPLLLYGGIPSQQTQTGIDLDVGRYQNSTP